MNRPERNLKLGLSTALLALAAVTLPATATADATSLKPVHKSRHALSFSVKDVPAESVEDARVRFRNHRTGERRVRSIAVERVQRAIEQPSRLRVHRSRRVLGRLLLGTGESTDPPPDDPPTPPDDSIPTEWKRYSSFESSMNEGVDYGWRVDDPFSANRTGEAGAAAGSNAVEITTNGGNNDCSCPRMTYDNVGPLGPGDEFWMGGSWYVKNAERLEWSRLMNLGHFESSGDPDNWYFALFSRDPGKMEVVARNYNTDRGMSVLMAPRPIPENRWFSVDIRASLSPTGGAATTDVYLDGELVSHSTRANMWSSRPLKFYNAGLSYFWPQNGSTTVYFDAPRVEW